MNCKTLELQLRRTLFARLNSLFLFLSERKRKEEIVFVENFDETGFRSVSLLLKSCQVIETASSDLVSRVV